MKIQYQIFLLGVALLGMGVGTVVAQTNPPPVQTFYIPLPEPEMLTAAQSLAQGTQTNNQWYPKNPLTRVIGISVIGSDTVIYYNHKEGGYEADIHNPTNIYSSTNTSGTQIWGDGDTNNGVAPGYPSDIFTGGNTIILTNTFNSATLPTQASPYYSGGDKVASSKAIAVSSSVWATGSGTLMSDAVEVYDTYSWGTNFRTPVGTNTVSTTASFNYVRASIMAGVGGATVEVRTPNNTLQTTVTLAEGQTYYTTNDLAVGARITSDKKVQVNLVTGDPTGFYESRWYPLLPVNLWSSSYYTPVSTPNSARGRGDANNTTGSDTTVYLYNPGASSMNVSYVTRGSNNLVSNLEKNGTNYTTGPWRGSGFGNVYGPLISITNTNDYTITNAPEGAWIAVLKSVPTSNLSNRVNNARNAGAAAVVLINNNNSTNNFTNNIGTTTMPVVGVTTNQYSSLINGTNNWGWVRVSGSEVTNVISVPAGGYTNRIVADGYGARFYSTNNTDFYAVSATDSTGTGGQSRDWGYGLVAQPVLTPQALVGMGFGRDPDPTDTVRPNENGSPVWVTTSGNGNTNALVYIDYDADPTTGAYTDPNGYKYDTTIQLRELESVKVFNPSGDQTGMLLYTLDKGVKLAAAWGQDPMQATTGQPGFDGGTGVPPLPQFIASKKSVLHLDVDGDGYISPGDHIKYTLEIQNISRVPVDGVTAQDNLPASVTYIANSTVFTPHTNIPQSIADNPSGNPFPLSGAGKVLPLPSLPPGETWTVTYEVQVKSFNDLPPGTTSVINAATINSETVSEPEELEEQQPIFGRIGDFVWVDTNGNGIQDAGEPGLNGVTVKLLDSSGNPVLDANDNPRTTTTVTESGNPGFYQFVGVPQGDYILEFVTPSGYVFTTQNADGLGINGDANSDASPETGRTSSFNLTAGQTLSSVDAGMYQPVVISGSITRDLTGDLNGDAAHVGVTVTLKDSSGNDIDSDPGTPGVQPTTTTTAGNGSYSFSNLPPGDYRVVQTVPGGFDAIADVDGGNLTVIGDVTLINIVSGSNVTDQNFVNRAPGGISGYVRVDTNGDNVGDAPQSGVTVTLKDSNGNDIDSDPGTPGVQPTTTTTAGDGSYSFSGVTTGNYRVVQSVPGGYLAVADVDGGNLTVIGDVTLIGVLPEATTTNQNFVNRQTGAISGTILKDTTGDGVGDTPQGGVTVTLKDSNGDDVDSDPNTPGVQPTTTTTAVDGTYSFPGILPGDYQVVQSVPSGYNAIWDADGGDFTVIGNVTPIAVVAGQTTTGRDFTNQQPGALTGTVRSDTTGDGIGDTPQAGVTVTLKDSNGDDIDSDPGAPGVQPTTTTTAGDGTYSFSGLTPGDYQVVQSVPSGYVAIGDADGGDFTVIGNVTPIGVLPGQTVATRDFTNQQPGNISGKVWLDTNHDNTGDTSFPGVTLALVHQDGTPVLDDNSDPITTTSAGDGTYSFNNIPPGTYGVQKTTPPGYTSVTDSDGGDPSEILPIVVLPGQSKIGNDFVMREIPGTISGSVMVDTDLDGTGDTGLANVTLTLVDASGNPVLDENSNPITTTTAGDGTYSFTSVPSGTYGVRRADVSGYLGLSDSDGGEVGWIGDMTDIVLPPAGDMPNNDFLLRTQKCEPTWIGWQDKWDNLGVVDTTPTGNDDGDGLTNLLEYAFCLSPKSGSGTAYCMTPNIDAVDKVDLTYRRTAGGAVDVIYQLEYAATLGENSTTWTTVNIPPANVTVFPQTDGTDKVRVSDLESITGLASGTGFVRLKVSMDADHDGIADVPAISASTDVGGWIETPLDLRIRSFNDPFLQCPLFVGMISEIDGQDIVSAVSGGGIDYNALVTAKPSYIEILTGPYQGHRFDITAGGVNRFTTATDLDVYSGTPPFNTVSAPQAGLVGAQFVIRPYRTLGDVFPPRAFIATDDSETASMVQMYAGDQWNTYWLYDDGNQQNSVPGWVAVGDLDLNDASGNVLPPGQGGFIYTRQENTPGAKFMIYGKVRPNDFIRPLIAGWNNVGGGYPLIQSPNGRNMTAGTNPGESNFYGNRNWKNADQFRIWRGDYYDSISEESYDSYFMVAGTQSRPVPPDWFKTGDATYVIQNNALLFKPDYSIIISRKYAIPDYRMPSPWKP